MSKIYKSARGKMVDMDQIKLNNETTAAVGNMRVNARGDLLGVGGQIATGRNQLMDQVYAVEPAPYSPNDPETFAQNQAVASATKAKELHDLANNLAQPAPLEPIAPALTQPAARGSLASAVAKTVSVNQAAIPNPKKSNGPARI